MHLIALRHYVFISFIVSFSCSTLLVFLADNTFYHLTFTEEVYASFMFSLISYSFVVVTGTTISYITKLLTRKVYMLYAVFLLAGTGLYYFNPWLNREESYVFFIAALIFVVLDHLFSRKDWGYVS